VNENDSDEDEEMNEEVERLEGADLGFSEQIK
jgi:hypothetical protein